MSNVSDFSQDEELLGQFLDYANECTAEMRTFMDQLKAAGSSDALIDQLYTGAHNLKGMSSSFGFSLMTDVAGLMCLYIKKKTSGHEADLLDSLLKAMETILAHKILGDGGEKGVQLKQRLTEKVDTALAA